MDLGFARVSTAKQDLDGQIDADPRVIGSRVHRASKRIMTGVDIKLLVVPDCPNESIAAATLRTALDDVGVAGTTFHTTLIDTGQRAEQGGFTGSPTILSGGHDPFFEPGRTPALAWRIYRSEAGTAGSPVVGRAR